MPSVKLSTIIVNYNTEAYLKQCLHSVYSSESRLNLEVIVVDNNSHDGSRRMIKRDFPQVRLIENDENPGFARGNNIGIAAACGEYILLLNSDTEIVDDALGKMSAFLDKHLEVAVVTSRLIYPDFTEQGVARKFPTPMNALFGRRSLLTRLFPRNRFSQGYLISRTHVSSKIPFEVDWVSGACLMVRKHVLQSVGNLDEGFFMYWEDADLCFRIKQEGWKVYCVPDAVVVHYEGKSSHHKMNNRLIVEFNKSAYRYYRKHHIRSSFHVMNLLAFVGLALRTLLLLSANICKRKPLGGLDETDHV